MLETFKVQEQSEQWTKKLGCHDLCLALLEGMQVAGEKVDHRSTTDAASFADDPPANAPALPHFAFAPARVAKNDDFVELAGLKGNAARQVKGRQRYVEVETGKQGVRDNFTLRALAIGMV